MLIAGVAACIVLSTTSGLATRLGKSSLGFRPETNLIAACGNGMEIGYTSGFGSSLSGYVVNGVDISDIPSGCLDKNLSLTFYNAAGNGIGSAIRTILPTAGTTQIISIRPHSNTIDVNQVAGVSAVVP